MEKYPMVGIVYFCIHQGRLADSSGNPLTGKYNLEFRIYDVPTGEVPLWTGMGYLV